MGSPKDKFRDFAVAFWKTSKQDLDRAKDALKEGYYPYAVFHSQQCVEKVTKALLEMEDIFVRDHDVSDMFTTYILKKEEDEEIKKDLYEILDILYWFRGTWTLSRYPVIMGEEVVSPAEQYNKEDAETALEKAKFVFEFVTSLLKERYKLKVTENNDQEK